MAFLECEFNILDIIYQLDEKEIQEVINYLTRNGYVNPMKKNSKKEILKNIFDKEWDEICIRLSEIRHRLTLEEENIIKIIASKFI